MRGSESSRANGAAWLDHRVTTARLRVQLLRFFLVIRFVVFSSIHIRNDNYNNNSSLDGFGQFNAVLKYSDESLYFGTFTK